MSQPQQPAQPYQLPGTPAAPPAYGPPPGWAPAPASYPPPPTYGAPAGYGSQHYPAHPYPPQPYPGQPFPAPQYAAQPYPGQMPLLACRICGSVPAADTTFRGHRGMLVVMQFLRNRGPFCRDCGLGVFRYMTSHTLVEGWWSYGSVIAAPITVLINLARRGQVARLAPPQPNPYGPSRPPMNPGKPLPRNPLTWVGLGIPVALLVLLIVAATS